MDKHKKLTETENVNNEIIDNPELEEDLEKKDSVISEQIKPWHKRKFKKIMSVIGLSLLAGILFGIAARFVFKYSDGIISKIFGLSVQYDNVVGPPPDSSQPQPTGKGPDMPDNPGNTQDPNGVKIGQTPGNPGEKQGEPGNTGDQTDPAAYVATVENLNRVSDALSKSLVTVNSVTRVVNWLGDNIEQSESTVGVAIAENPAELFILTYYDKISSADRIEIAFPSGNTNVVTIYNHDENYNLAVLSINKQSLKLDDINGIVIPEIGDSDAVYPGMPIVGVGSIDGSNKMVDYGYITSDGYVEYLTDSSIELFTTSLLHSHTEEGIVADTDGRVIGIITRVLGGSVKADINKCMKVNSIIKIAEKLCNGGNMVYCGINLENIPSWVLRENELENGIYVNSVEASSPASDAGIRKGDIITAINDVKISDVKEYTDFLMNATENTSINVDLYRSTKASDNHITVTVRPINRNN